MKIVKFFTALLVFAFLVNCSKITEKVEEKVNEKVNEKIDENLKKIDSSIDRKSIDSLMKQLDTLKTKADSLLLEESDKRSKKSK
ncbi:MAG TPA: hypothetical protein PK605_13920 [Ignavibacteria bacterium]|nr:hypothetical protein [Bacteroidota bacterium]HRF66390.1 hypothetical protein [Ignavibacteria bacterium]HRJ05494.1 hypothetical protein [Ignavibacteria bacterium]